MSTEFRGKVKRRFWIQPPCVVRGGEPDPFAELALADFKRECKMEGDPFHVYSGDVFADALEDYEQADCPVE